MPCPILLVLLSRREANGNFSRRKIWKRTGEEEGSRMPIYNVAGRHSGLVVAKGGEGRWCSGLRGTDGFISTDYGECLETFEDERYGAFVSSEVH